MSRAKTLIGEAQAEAVRDRQRERDREEMTDESIAAWARGYSPDKRSKEDREREAKWYRKMMGRRNKLLIT
jgi:hypothetical protein